MSKSPKVTHLAGSTTVHPENYDYVTAEERDIFTSDPATFFVIQAVLMRIRESVTEFEKLFEDREELKVVLEKTLADMVRVRLIDIVEDKIIILRKNPYINLRGDNFQFIPKLMSIAAHRVRKNYEEDPRSAFKNSDDLSWRNYPDHPLVRARVNAIMNNCIAELDKLEDEVAENPDITGEDVRFCLVMSSGLKPEDF